MDPLTCLGLASSIVQIVDFTYKLISGSKEIYDSVGGITKENVELETVIKDLILLCDNLRPRPSTVPKRAALSDDEKALQSISSICKEVADEILVALGKLKAEGKHLRWKAFYVSIKAVTGEKKMKSLQERLARVQSELLLRLLNTLSNETAAITTALSDMAETLDVLRNLMDVYRLEDGKDAEARDPICVEELSIALTELTTEGALVSKSLDILESLYYDSIESRRSAVKEEHHKTFRWIFERFDEEWDCDPPRFTEWLECKNGIYWIAGKPGSGKSTLMKFLWHHFQTRNILEAWAGSRELITACHFFWNAGNDETQMSLDAMLRSLLYQALIQCPELIPSICASKFSDPFTRWRQREIRSKVSIWRTSELIETFEKLVGSQTRRQNFCFFIDGLDEYAGDHFDIIQMFKKISAAENVKVVISSRPWNVFEEAFGGEGSWKLLLQDLTRSDITEYVNSKLAEDTRFRVLAARDNRYEDLIQQTVKKARGVFLWVVLVVESLRNGLSDYDEISDMQRRLDFLPSNLRKFFLHIINGVEEVRQSQMAETFQVCLHAKNALPMAALACLKQERTQPDYALSKAIAPISGSTMLKTKSKMHLYLNAICKGLLEINHDPHKSFSFSYKLDFLHRTVRDFLMTPELSQVLKEKVSHGFDVNLSLCRASLAMLKMLQPEEMNNYKLTAPATNTGSDLISHALTYAAEFEKSSGQTPFRILNSISDVHAKVCEPTVPQTMFLRKAAAADLCNYVEAQLTICPSILEVSEFRSIVDVVLHPVASPELPTIIISQTMTKIIPKHVAINQAHRRNAVISPATSITSTCLLSANPPNFPSGSSIWEGPLGTQASPESRQTKITFNRSIDQSIWGFHTSLSSEPSRSQSQLESPSAAVEDEKLPKSDSGFSASIKAQDSNSRRKRVSQRLGTWLKRI